MTNEIYEGDSAKAVAIHHVPKLEKCFFDILSQRPRLATYLLNAGPTLRYIVKLFDPSGVAHLNRETAFASLFASLEIKTTETIASHPQPEVGNLPYRMSRFVEGYDLDEGLLTGRIDEEVVPEIMKKVGASVAKVHGVNRSEAPWALSTEVDWASSLKSRIQSSAAEFSIDDLAGAEASQVKDAEQKLLAEVEGGNLNLESPVAVMGDLSPKHIIVEESEYEYHLNGILGLRYSFIGDPAWDFVRLERTLFVDEPDLQDPFLEGYASLRSVPEDWDRHRDLYRRLDDFFVAADGFLAESTRADAWRRLGVS